MKKRYKLKKKKSNKIFKKGLKVHRMNYKPRTMRGGTRL